MGPCPIDISGNPASDGNLLRLLASMTRSNRKGRRWASFSIGASNGNRTRIASLGSWSFTIRLYPLVFLTCILYTIFFVLSIGIGKFFSEPSDILRLFWRSLPKFLHVPWASTYSDSGDGISPPNSFHTEVPYEQLPVQRFRQQQLDLDHPHRPAVPLLRRRLRLLSSSGAALLRGSRPCFWLIFINSQCLIRLIFPSSRVFFSKTRCIFGKNMV